MYRRFSNPPKKQPLQLLYPGRILLPGEGFTSEGIPNEDPQGAAITQDIDRTLNSTAEWESNQYSRLLGGHPKTFPEFVDEPEQFVDNSRTVQIQPVVPENVQTVPPPLNTNDIEDIVRKTMNTIRAEESELKQYPDPSFTLPSLPKRWRIERFQYPSSKGDKWIYGIIFLAVIVMIVGLYLMKKK